MKKDSKLKYRTIGFLKVFTDLKEALKSSNNEWGLDYHAKSELDRRLGFISKASTGLYYLCEEYGKKEVFYVTGKILHRFSWISCLHSGNAAKVKMYDSHFEISEYLFNREDLRKEGCLWTVD